MPTCPTPGLGTSLGKGSSCRPSSASRRSSGVSPLPVLCENVISRLRSRVAREPALGVVPLWRGASFGAGLERIGCRVVIEHAISPPAAVSEPLAVLHHEVHVQQGAWYCCFREKLIRFRFPMNLGHLGSVRDRLAVAGNTFLIGIDHHRIT